MIIKLKDISKYRTQMLGIATLLIAISHMIYQNETVSILASFGQIGVDIFLFLSGFGCFYSLFNDNNKNHFYFKRFKRIIPIYLIIISIYSLYQKPTIDYIIKNFSLITFFTKGILTEWYVAAIITLYIITPTLYNFLINKKDIFIFTSILLICFSSMLAFYLQGTLFIINEIFICRIPIYMIGMTFAYKILIKNQEELYISKILFIFLILVFVFLLFYRNVNRWTLIRLMFIPCSLYLIGLLTKIDLRFLNFIGTCSFEVYLTFEKILSIVQNNILALIISIIFSYFIKLIFDFIKKIYYNIFIKNKTIDN